MISGTSKVSSKMATYNVLKAGGTSVGTPEAMEIIANEAGRIHSTALKSDRRAITILDVSATGEQSSGAIRDKNTNLLERMAAGENVEDYFRELREREQRAVQRFGLGAEFNDANFSLLQMYLENSQLPADKRYAGIVTSVGERLKARQMAALINNHHPGLAEYVDYDMTGVSTMGGHVNARRTSRTYVDIRGALSGKYDGKIIVVGGFMGIDETTRHVTTLERGGSDTHAVWLAAAMGADKVYIYSDTSLRRTDPKIVPDADVIPKVTYGELSEFIGFGSKIVADRANDAAEEALLELILKNTFRLDDQTLVSSNIAISNGGIKGVAASPSVVLSLAGLPVGPGAYNRITEILTKYKIDFVNEAGDRRYSSMVLVNSPENPLEGNIGHTLAELDKAGFTVSIHHGMTRVGIIGEGIGRSPTGLVAIGETLRDLHLPVNQISLPIDGRAISIVTDKTHVPNVVSRLYSNLFRNTGPYHR